jgi:hypothetical protein
MVIVIAQETDETRVSRRPETGGAPTTRRYAIDDTVVADLCNHSSFQVLE